MNYWGLRTAIRICQIHKKSEMILSDMKIYKHIESANISFKHYDSLNDISK